jgi:hypothetical protein
MKKFVAVYLGSANAMSGWEKLSEAERNQRQDESLGRLDDHPPEECG